MPHGNDMASAKTAIVENPAPENAGLPERNILQLGYNSLSIVYSDRFDPLIPICIDPGIPEDCPPWIERECYPIQEIQDAGSK